MKSDNRYFILRCIPAAVKIG